MQPPAPPAAQFFRLFLGPTEAVQVEGAYRKIRIYFRLFYSRFRLLPVPHHEEDSKNGGANLKEERTRDPLILDFFWMSPPGGIESDRRQARGGEPKPYSYPF